jgi:hypothetical protein
MNDSRIVQVLHSSSNAGCDVPATTEKLVLIAS